MFIPTWLSTAVTQKVIGVDFGLQGVKVSSVFREGSDGYDCGNFKWVLLMF